MEGSSALTQELDAAADRWQWALDAESRALDAADISLRPSTISAERTALTRERHVIASLLERAARVSGIEPPPWLSLNPVTPRMLGLLPRTKACIFDLDGVLTDSGVLHAAAWAQTLDPILLNYAHATDSAFVPFDREVDYRAYFDGRSRLEGIRLFLSGRGLHLPEGDLSDGPTASSVVGVARRKGELLDHALRGRSLVALFGVQRYLQAAGRARLGRAVVSASTTTLPMLQIAGLVHLVEKRVDAETMRSRHLRSRPAPDLLLAACRELGVAPADAVSLTHSGAGVVAAQSAGLHVIGVASGVLGEQIAQFGAPTVVPSLWSLLDSSLRAGLRPRDERPSRWT